MLSLHSKNVIAIKLIPEFNSYNNMCNDLVSVWNFFPISENCINFLKFILEKKSARWYKHRANVNLCNNLYIDSNG